MAIELAFAKYESFHQTLHDASRSFPVACRHVKSIPLALARPRLHELLSDFRRLREGS